MQLIPNWQNIFFQSSSNRSVVVGLLLIGLSYWLPAIEAVAQFIPVTADMVRGLGFTLVGVAPVARVVKQNSLSKPL